MSLTRLQLRVLTILGLPIVGATCTKPTPSPDDRTTVLEIPPATSVPLAVASTTTDDEDDELFDHRAARAYDCGPDRSRTIVCGEAYGTPDDLAPSPYDGCSETTVGMSDTIALGRDDVDLPLDPTLTDRFRKQTKNAHKSCCYSQCDDVKTAAVGNPVPPGFRTRSRCMVAIEKGTRHPSASRSDCPAAVKFGTGPDGAYAAPYDAEHSDVQTKFFRKESGFVDLQVCCYDDVTYARIMRGRAFRDTAGEVIVAATRREAAGGTRAAVELDASTRAELARLWIVDAELEHASVAAFSSLSLGLMANGAPPDLVAGCHAAALDEIRHAAQCYELASTYAGVRLSAGPLPASFEITTDLVRLVVDTFRDGCIGETVAAVVARRAAQACDMSAPRSMLASIADDEERHAELGWRILRWAITRPGCREAISTELGRLRATPSPRRVKDGPFAAFGVLSEAAQ